MTNFAVIGCGYWGVNYVRLLHELPQVRLLVACDSSPQRLALLRERYPLVSVTESVEETLRRRSIDAVVVATPASTHYAIVRAALRAGKHVLVEKPLTISVEEAEDLQETARMCGRVLMVGLTFLYNPGIWKMKELMRDPRFGMIYYLHCTRTNMGPVRSDVSVLWDLASHDLAICDFLLERRPVWAQANAATVLKHDLEDVAFLTLGYPGGVLANIHVSWVDPNKVREVVVVGSQRRIVFDDLKTGERVRIYEKGIEPAPQEADNFGKYRLLVRDGDIISPRVDPGEPLRNQVEHFLSLIVRGGAAAEEAEIGVANVRALAAVERSLAMQGTRVAV